MTNNFETKEKIHAPGSCIPPLSAICLAGFCEKNNIDNKGE